MPLAATVRWNDSRRHSMLRTKRSHSHFSMPCFQRLAEKLASHKFIYNQMEDQLVKRTVRSVLSKVCVSVYWSWAACSSPFLLGTSVCSTAQSSKSRAASTCPN